MAARRYNVVHNVVRNPICGDTYRRDHAIRLRAAGYSLAELALVFDTDLRGIRNDFRRWAAGTKEEEQ